MAVSLVPFVGISQLYLIAPRWTNELVHPPYSTVMLAAYLLPQQGRGRRDEEKENSNQSYKSRQEWPALCDGH